MNISGKCKGLSILSTIALSSCCLYCDLPKNAYVYLDRDWVPLALASDPNNRFGEFKAAFVEKDLVLTLNLSAPLTTNIHFGNMELLGVFSLDELPNDLGGPVLWADITHEANPSDLYLQPSRIYNGFLFEGKRYRDPNGIITLSAGMNQLTISLYGDDWTYNFDRFIEPDLRFVMNGKEDFWIFSSDLRLEQGWIDAHGFPDFFYIEYGRIYEPPPGWSSTSS